MGCDLYLGLHRLIRYTKFVQEMKMKSERARGRWEAGRFRLRHVTEGIEWGAGTAEATVHSATSLAVERYRGRWNISDQGES